MKKNIFLFAFAAVIFFTHVAFADVKMGIIDTRKIVEQSDAGKNLVGQLKTRQQAIQTEATSFEKKLKAEEQDIINQRKTLKPDEFEAKKKAFEQELIKSRQTVIAKSADLDGARKKALAELQKALAKASAAVADEKKLDIIVDRQFVVLAQENMDITADVMRKFNETVKSVALDAPKK